MVNQNVQDTLKKFQDSKNKEHEKMQKQTKELREDFNIHKSETKDTIKREIYELKMTTQTIKEELKKDMENLKKKNPSLLPHQQTRTREDRISEFKDKIELKENIEEILNNSRAVKGMYKNSVTPLKEET
jgi:hypothetical protein